MPLSNTMRAAAFALCAMPMAVAMIGEVQAADPTSGRVQQRQAENRKEYFKCANFSLRVFNACLQQNQSKPQAQRRCRSSYQGNLQRCRRATL